MKSLICDRLHRQLPAALWSIFIVLVFLVLNHEIYLPVGKNLAEYTGDGIKNLYTFAYYLKYDKGFDFSGLFYPYEELVVYMDAQPLWVWVIKGLESVFHFQVESPVLYIHLILLFNLWLCGFFLFKILFYYTKNSYFTFIGTFVIVLLSPQIFRFASHFALGNMGIIPMFWWWYICLSAQKKIFPYIPFAFGVFLTGFIHPYLMLMLLFLFASFELIASFIYKKFFWKKLLCAVAPLIMFQVAIRLLDHVEDRPVNAWGAKEFACRWYDLLLPLTGDLKAFFIERFPKISPYYTEGHGYITVFGLLVLILLLANGIFALIRKRWKAEPEYNSAVHWLLASLPVLLFAFFIPFRWSDGLIDLIAPLKQFRGTGRFVVVFYYVYLVFVFVYLSRLYLEYPKSISLVMVICLLISFKDILNNSRKIRSDFWEYGKLDAYHHFKSKAEELFSKAGDLEQYQCIIPYPASTEGTEVIWLDADWTAKIHYFWFSYFYHLPVATVHSSRVSYSKNMELVQLSGFFTSPKPVLEKFDPDRKCLVLAEEKHQYENIPLIKNAVWLNTVDGLALYSIDIKDLKHLSTEERHPDWIDTSAYTLLAVNKFDRQKNGHLFVETKQDSHEIIEFEVADDKKDKTVRVLFWYVPKHNEDSEIPIVSAYQVVDGQEIFIRDWRERHTHTYNYRKGWFCVDFPLSLNNETTKVKLKISSQEILVDDVAVYLQR